MKNSPVISIAIFVMSVTSVVAQQAGRPVAVLVERIGGRSLPMRSNERSSARSESVVSIGATERRAFDLMNAVRQSGGLALLEWSSEASALARMHAQNMAEGKFFSHKGMDGETVDGRASQLGVKWRAIGENIATMRGYEDPAGKAVETWMNSPSHKRNILNGIYNQTAIGAATANDGTVYFAQVFLAK